MLLVASLQPVKLRAVQEACGFAPKGFDCASGVAAQPQGRLEIRQGAKNRLAQIPLQALEPAIALETGIICSGENSIQDITCCLLRTRHGTLETWSETALHDPEVVRKWLELKAPQRSSVTLGSLYPGNLNPNDWYKFCNPKSRLEILSDVVTKVLYQWQNIQAGFPTRLPAALRSFKGVAFLDLQEPFASYSRDLVQTVRRLADRLVFDTVAVLDARGFLLAAEFMHENYPVVMIRKAGKLPADELHHVQFQKEYGPPDTFCLSKNVIKAGARVLVIDDVVATGNSMKAAEVLIQEAKGEVVAFLAPYALVEPDGSLMGASLGPRLRFHSTQVEAASAKALAKPYPMPRIWPTNRRFIIPPSLNDTIPPEYLRVPVQWGQFRFSSNIWFSAGEIKDREIFVVMNPMQSRETWDVVQLLSILYRKDPKSVKVEKYDAAKTYVRCGKSSPERSSAGQSCSNAKDLGWYFGGRGRSRDYEFFQRGTAAN
jgi:adenine phosphoribosyltransferase